MPGDPPPVIHPGVGLRPTEQFTRLDLGHLGNLVEAVLLALEHPSAVGESFNIGNARSAVTIYDLATRIKRLTGCAGEIRFVPLHYTDVELRIPNVDKARSLLGFEAEVELDEGLSRTIAWYRARLGAAA